MSVLKWITKPMTKDESRDTGMAVVLLLLLWWVVSKRDGIILSAMIVHIVNMTVPRVFQPVAVIWFGFSHLLGTIMSAVLLSIAFLLVVTPIGVLRKRLGSDAMRLRAFKAGKESVMVTRNHVFVGRDIERPY